MDKEIVDIDGSNPWVKIVDFLQQNWACIEQVQGGSVRVWFYGDTSGVFDKLEFSSVAAAEAALIRNGFKRFLDHPDLTSFLVAPEPPFWKSNHPNGPIYSSGRFWR